jgi:hypothetical protein
LLSAHAERRLARPKNGCAGASSHITEAGISPDEDDAAPEISLPSQPVVQPWERRVHEARADLEVRKLEEEAAELERRRREIDEAREMELRRAQLDRQREAERAQEHRSELERLASIRNRGEMIAILTGAPPAYRAEVTRDLGSYVTSDQFPPSLNFWQVQQYLAARIEHVIKPWRDEKDAELRSRQAEKHVEGLIWHGRMHAKTRTSGWDWSQKERAMREVERALRDEVEADWSRDDVVDLADEVLEEWE